MRPQFPFNTWYISLLLSYLRLRSKRVLKYPNKDTCYYWSSHVLKNRRNTISSTDQMRIRFIAKPIINIQVSFCHTILLEVQGYSTIPVQLLSTELRFTQWQKDNPEIVLQINQISSKGISNISAIKQSATKLCVGFSYCSSLPKCGHRNVTYWLPRTLSLFLSSIRYMTFP